MNKLIESKADAEANVIDIQMKISYLKKEIDGLQTNLIGAKLALEYVNEQLEKYNGNCEAIEFMNRK